MHKQVFDRSLGPTKIGLQVWGVLWELNMEHLKTLDGQEGVPTVYNRSTMVMMGMIVIADISC